MANHPSSSSRREGAGRGAPGPSWVGRRTESLLKGFKDFMDERRPVCWRVSITGSGRRDQPKEDILSRKEVDVMMESM